MFQQLISSSMQAAESEPIEGELYKVVCIQGHSFPLRYGYYEERDRKNPAVEPMPIYPDFLQEPKYTDEGFPFVTKMQDPCLHYLGKPGKFSECADCQHFFHGEELIGVCLCPQNKRATADPPPGNHETENKET